MTLCEYMCSLLLQKGEKPYKIVKARPKKVAAATSIVLCVPSFSTCICQPFYHVRTVQGQSVLEAQNSTVETFGWWQTEEYVPPPVVDVST